MEKALALPAGRSLFQKVGDDFAIGDTNQQKWNHDEYHCNCIDCCLVHKCVPTASLNTGGRSQKKIINCGRPTKGQRGNLPYLPHYNRNSTDTGSSDQLDTDLGAHDQTIVKRVTNGHIAVIGHHGQEETL